MKSPYQIIAECIEGEYGQWECLTAKIRDALQREGWYFTWCEQKYLKENENVK